jgi:hypothetical protein
MVLKASAFVGSVLVLVFFGEQVAFAQDRAGVTNEREWPIDPASYPRPTHPATRASGPIVLDGRPDEVAWEVAPPITRFIQSRPDVGHPATQETIVRVLYDDEALYIAAICYDTQPDNLTVMSMERDFPPLGSDIFSFVLNPNRDRLDSFLFYMNPHGAYGDARTFDDNRAPVDYAWDVVVEGETQLTDFGWTVEIAIPWSTIGFNGVEGSQEWGFNVQRRIRRINESAAWSPLGLQEYQPTVSRAGTLVFPERRNF